MFFKHGKCDYRPVWSGLTSQWKMEKNIASMLLGWFVLITPDFVELVDMMTRFGHKGK